MLSSKQLHYVKGVDTYTINLYTTEAEAGNDRLAIDDNGTTLYAALGIETAPTASHLRVQKDDLTWAVLFDTASEVTLTSYVGQEMLEASMDVTDDGMHPVTATVNNIAFGTVSPPGIAALEGTSVLVTATPFSGKAFSSWTIYTPTETTVSVDNPVNLTITAPTSLIATFV